MLLPHQAAASGARAIRARGDRGGGWTVGAGGGKGRRKGGGGMLEFAVGCHRRRGCWHPQYAILPILQVGRQCHSR